MSNSYHLVYQHDVQYADDEPYGWIQWKGTNVCIDLHCVCGGDGNPIGHYDGDFMYSVQCVQCGRKYAVGQNIKLIELNTPELVAANEEYHGDYKEFGHDEDGEKDGEVRMPEVVGEWQSVCVGCGEPFTAAELQHAVVSFSTAYHYGCQPAVGR